MNTVVVYVDLSANGEETLLEKCIWANKKLNEMMSSVDKENIVKTIISIGLIMISFCPCSGFEKNTQHGSIAGLLSLVSIIIMVAVIPTPSFAADNKLSVFRVEIDTTPLQKRNGSQVIRDLYINGGENDGVSLSEVFDVYRKKNVQDRKIGGNFEISILVGQVKVIGLSSNVAIARTIALTSSDDRLVLRYRTVMVGDYTVPVRAEDAVKGAQLDGKIQTQNSAILFPSKFLFERDDWKLKKEAKGMLATIHDMFNESRDNSILIAGHTCNLGMEKYNLELSKKRAQSVAYYLTQSSGIPKDHISIESHGEKFPVASNDREEGRVKNRRVEISFLPPDLITQASIAAKAN